MVIGIVGIIFLSRLQSKRAGQAGGRLASTGRWRSQVAAREVAHAQDQRGSQTSFPGAVTAPDSRQLCRRSGDGFRLPEGRRGGRAEMAGHRRMGRRPGHHRPSLRRGENRSTESQSPEPDYADIRHELQTNKHVTLQLLWEEYREKTSRTATATADSVTYTGDGCADRKSFCDRSIGRARSCLSTTPATPFPSTQLRPARRQAAADLRGGVGGQQLHLLRGDCDAGLGRLDRRPHARPSSFWAACPRSSSRTI